MHRVGATPMWMRDCALKAVRAGIIFLLFEMLLAQIFRHDFLLPLHLMAAVVMGPVALHQIDDPAALLAALFIHLPLCALYGLIFGMLAPDVVGRRHRKWGIVAAATAWGALLGAYNLAYVAHAVGLFWLARLPLWPQIAAHAFFFGSAFGLLLVRHVHEEAEAVIEIATPEQPAQPILEEAPAAPAENPLGQEERSVQPALPDESTWTPPVP